VWRLVRRRELWWPTALGWLIGLCCVAGVATLAALELDDFLSIREPARGRDGLGARTLVVEGWLEARELDQALAALKRGRYVRLLTSGGPIESWNDESPWPSYAERAAAYLRPRLPPGIVLLAVPAPAVARDRTYASAQAVAARLGGAGLGAEPLDVFTVSIHARRSRTVNRLAFGPAVEVGVLPAAPRGYDAQRWWSSSRGAKAVIGELLSLAWTTCCFWPDASVTATEAARPDASPAATGRPEAAAGRPATARPDAPLAPATAAATQRSDTEAAPAAASLQPPPSTR
jgi:hypothetical protein